MQSNGKKGGEKESEMKVMWWEEEEEIEKIDFVVWS